MTFEEGVKILFKKSSSRDIRGYFLNVVFIGCVLIFILPNLSTELSNYNSCIEELKDTKLNTEKWTEGFKDKQKTTLVLITDKNQWEISSQHVDSWDKLQDKSNIGKEIKLYCRNNTSNKYVNPSQIEIDHHVIYAINDDLTWNYIFIGLVLLFTLYNVSIISFNLKYK